MVVKVIVLVIDGGESQGQGLPTSIRFDYIPPASIFNYFSSTRSPMSNPVGDADAATGTLKVVVVRGKRLVVRDFKSSDPYVKLRLGDQLAKTKVINSCLNPIWDEELTFSLAQPLLTLYLEVFDKDRFKADDKMGYAHINLQPLVSAARLKQILKVSSGETTLRKVIPDSDNCLVRESCINCVNGEIFQEVWLRLSGVDSGEIELKLKLEYPNPASLSC